MRSPRPVAPGIPFVGRSAELDALCTLVDRAADGPGQVGLVEGEAGIGKSRLLAEALAHAEDRGFQVLQGSTGELERDRPFRALVEALGEPAGRSSPRPSGVS
ncbi:MAG: BREX system ATP-binding domain-containing protein [Egibacteraceae bacterium]